MLFLGGIVGVDFFLILSTGHGAYLTGRSAAQLMIRLTTNPFIVIKIIIIIICIVIFIVVFRVFTKL